MGTSSACGVNPGSALWSDYYLKFQPNDRIMDLDVSGMDETMQMFHVVVIQSFIQQFYLDPFESGFACMMIQNCVTALRFNLRKGTLLGQGNSSGNQMTTFLNTFVMHINIHLALYVQCVLHDEDYDQLSKRLKLVIYSDDSLSSLDRPWWNPLELARLFREMFGAVLTTSDKSAVTEDSWSTRDTMVFLSRNFRYKNGIVYCPLQYDSLISQLYYVRVPKPMRHDKDFIISQLNVNLSNVERELVEHEATFATKLTKEINEFIMDLS